MTILVARGLLEKERQAATKRLCRGCTWKAKPSRMAKRTEQARRRLPPYNATFHTCKGILSLMVLCNAKTKGMVLK